MDDDKANRRSASKGKQATRENLALAFIRSAAVALVSALVTSALQIGGVISMGVAHLLMFLAWLVSVIFVWFLGSYGNVVRFRLIFIAILSVVFVATDMWMVKKINAANSVEVGLSFVYLNGHGPTLELINLSDGGVAYTIKYTVMLWNLNLPERIDPLPIPVSSFDWIKPRMRSGPQNLFFTPRVEPLLHPGDHLFGCASVTCPACIRDHAYVVSIIWKQGGWFADISDENEGRCFRPTVVTREGIVAYVKGLSLEVPESSRIPIGSD